MTYLVLARKYRPRTFADLVGQEVVARTLQGAIEEQRVGHAYLFTGPRGTGKTTTARILAKALNCERGPALEPCLECARCRAIEGGSFIDLIEIDAASNRGIDDVRELRAQVASAPMVGRFKVYIVDEVHMMTTPAFNALLKTLEEPPPHVKFLLATTDPQKVPQTILSRCQVLKLAPLQEGVIAARLEHVFAQEGVQAEAGVAQEIARRSRGGMRDALSLADQLLSLVGAAPTLADLARLAAEGGAELAERVLDRLAAHDAAGVLAALPPGEGGESEIVASLLDRVRATLLVGLLGRETPLVQLDPEERALLAARAERAGLERLQVWLEELLVARERMARLPAHARVALELALLDLCRAEVGLPLAELAERLAALEARLAGQLRAPAAPSGATAPVPAAPSGASALVSRAGETAPRAGGSAPRPAPTDASPSRPEPARGEPAEDEHAPMLVPRAEPRGGRGAGGTRVTGTADAWQRFLEALARTSASLAETLRQRGRLADLSAGRALVQLANLKEHERAQVADARNQRQCQAAFAAALGGPVQVVLEDQAAARGSKDAYTGRVAELFEGRVEDDA